MAFCGTCGAKLPGQVKFCPECGSPTGMAGASAAGDATAEPTAPTLTLEDLQGTWEGLVSTASSVTIEGETITITGSARSGSFGFSLQDDPAHCGYRLVMAPGDDLPVFEEVLAKMEPAGGRLIPVIFGCTMEYDGRGLIVWEEFVRPADRATLPSGFRSSLRQTLNDRPAIGGSFMAPGMFAMGMGMPVRPKTGAADLPRDGGDITLGTTASPDADE